MNKGLAEKLQRLQNYTACIFMSASYDSNLDHVFGTLRGRGGGVNSVIVSMASYRKVHVQPPILLLFEKFLDPSLHQYWLSNDFISADIRADIKDSIAGWDRVLTGAFEVRWLHYFFLALAYKLFIAESSERVSITFVWVTAGRRFIWVKFVKVPEQTFETHFNRMLFPWTNPRARYMQTLLQQLAILMTKSY